MSLNIIFLPVSKHSAPNRLDLTVIAHKLYENYWALPQQIYVPPVDSMIAVANEFAGACSLEYHSIDIETTETLMPELGSASTLSKGAGDSGGVSEGGIFVGNIEMSGSIITDVTPKIEGAEAKNEDFALKGLFTLQTEAKSVLCIADELTCYRNSIQLSDLSASSQQDGFNITTGVPPRHALYMHFPEASALADVSKTKEYDLVDPNLIPT